MFVSFPDAPSSAQTRNPAPRSALDSGFAQSGAPRNNGKTGGRRPEERALLGARLEGSPRAPAFVADPSRLAAKGGEHLRMTDRSRRQLPIPSPHRPSASAGHGRSLLSRGAAPS